MAHWPWTDLLQDWFAHTVESPSTIPARQSWWFTVDHNRDAELGKKYRDLVESAAAGKLYHWLEKPEGRLALVLALDQLPRNIFRGSPRAFAYDAYTAALCLAAVHTGHDRRLKPIQRVFLYMPLQHFEDLQGQETGVSLYERLAHENPEWPIFEQEFLPFAKVHRDIIARFGRFPHRNQVLGRENTAEEAAYLAGDAPTFGQ
jgi:uncharacterized protein (DUF924 family)